MSLSVLSRLFVTLGAAVLPGMPGPLAQAPAEGSRTLCDPQDPRNKCPGSDCVCVDDTLEIVFRETGTNVLDLIPAAPGLRIEAAVVLDTKNADVQGWSYGVEHDDAFLTIRSATARGTDAAAALQGGFFVVEFTDLLTCRDDPDPRCFNPAPGAGLISATILSFSQPLSLAVGRNSLVQVEYFLEQPPAPAGTRLAFVEHLAVRSSPAVDINFTVRGRSHRPTLVLDGIVRPIAAPPTGFRRGDADGDGRRNVRDAIALIQAAVGGLAPPFDCDDLLDADDDGRRGVLDAIPLLAYVFQRGPALPGPFAACGEDPTADGLTCRETACR